MYILFALLRNVTRTAAVYVAHSDVITSTSRCVIQLYRLRHSWRLIGLNTIHEHIITAVTHLFLLHHPPTRQSFSVSLWPGGTVAPLVVVLCLSLAVEEGNYTNQIWTHVCIATANEQHFQDKCQGRRLIPSNKRPWRSTQSTVVE